VPVHVDNPLLRYRSSATAQLVQILSATDATDRQSDIITYFMRDIEARDETGVDTLSMCMSFDWKPNRTPSSSDERETAHANGR
jgi:hypothetical protein